MSKAILKRVVPGFYVLHGADHIRVHQHKGRTWNGRDGAIGYTEYVVTDTTRKKPEMPWDTYLQDLILVKCSTLAQVRFWLAKNTDKYVNI